jgi:hypothetical protein
MNTPLDNATLIAGLDFARGRLLASLTTIEKSGEDPAQVLAWRPGPSRAHIAWQAMHCCATHDRYLNVRILGGQPIDPAMCDAFAGGSTPSDDNVPSIELIRTNLLTHFTHLKNYVAAASAADLARVQDFPNNVQRSIGESILLLTWHETHHQGQIHLTWNLYKAAHNVK